MSADPAPVRERAVRWNDPSALAAAGRATAAVDLYRGMAEGKVPLPPSAVLLGFRPIEVVAEGHVVFEYVPHESHTNPMASVHGGVLASVFDAALGTAVATRLPKGVGYTTLELHTNFLRPVLETTGAMRCEARALHVGRTVATSEATLKDAAGKLYGHATSTCLVLSS